MEASVTSPDDIAAKVGLQVEMLDLSCEEKSFLSLSDFVHPWRLVFTELLPPLDLNDIDAENRGMSEKEKRVASLHKWKSRYGTEATYRVLVQSVLKCGKVSNAEGICQQLLQASKHGALLHSSTSPPTSYYVCCVGEPTNSLSMVIERLDEQYIEIEQLVFKTIKYRKVPLEDILNWIRFLPMTLRTQFAELIQGQAKVLTSASNVNELFFILSPYWNSLHPALLEYLVKKLGDKELKVRMDRYMEDLHRFRIQTTLGEFLDKWVGEIPPGYQEFVLELGEGWRNKTVEEFEQFRIRLSRLQSFGGGHTSFMKTAKCSSILVVLALPKHLFPINLKQKSLRNFMRCELVLRILVDGQCMLDLEKLVKYEEELLKHCVNEEYGDINKITYLLNQSGVDPNNIYDESGRTLLWWACYLQRSDLVIILIESGANVDLPTNDEYGESPLITASLWGHVAVCKALIERGAKIDYQNKKNNSAMYLASQYGHKDVAELLLDSGASVDKPNTEYSSTALIVASETGQTEIVRVLIARGATVDYQDKDGWSALYVASANGHTSVVELLIESGAQLDIQTKFGNTALTWATLNRHRNIVGIFIKAKSKLDIQDQNGLTALMKATDRGHKDVVESLLAGNANPNIIDKATGRSALFMASEQGNLEIVKLLVRGGADVDLKDKNDLTPLDIAKVHNQDEVYKFLLKHSSSRETKKDITDEQKKRAKTFTKRLRKIFDNLEWIFLRNRVLKEVEQSAREFPSLSAESALRQHAPSRKLISTKKIFMITEHNNSVGPGRI